MPPAKKKITTKTMDRLWSEIVKMKAGFKCEICGSTKRLNSHHVVRRNNYAVRFNTNNGVCLCVKCHMFGKESAHGNCVWFLDKMVKLRGRKWLTALKKESIKISYWKKTVEQTLERLRKEREELT